MASFKYRDELVVPEVHGCKALEIDSTSAYLRWAFLSTHSLSRAQMKALVFEFKTTDDALLAEAHFEDTPPREYKARLCGLAPGTKYRFQIRCRLRRRSETLFSRWSCRIEFTTQPSSFVVVTSRRALDVASVRQQLRESRARCSLLEREKQALTARARRYLPAHHAWDYRRCVGWVASLQHGLFAEYEAALLSSFRAEDVHGSKLHRLGADDVARLGVAQPAHNKILMAHIRELTSGDADPDFAASLTPESTLAEERSSRSLDRLVIVQKSHFAQPSGDEDSDSDSDEEDDASLTSQMLDQIVDDAKTPPQVSNGFSNSVGLSQSMAELLSVPSSSPPKKWRYKQGVLSVVVARASNVDNMDADEGPDSASDPYVELELNGHYKKESTAVVSDCANPEWNERFQLFPENPKKDVLKLVVWDKDRWTFDDKIGTYVLRIVFLNVFLNVSAESRFPSSTCSTPMAC